MDKQAQHVIFGTGPLGRAVMRALIEKGAPAAADKICMVNRSGKADVPAGVRVVAGDAYDPATTRALCEGATVVYQCAQPAYHEWVSRFPALNASILEGAASAGARFVFGDNLYMYGDVDGPIHEGLPYAATTRKGRTRAAMAEAVMAAHQAGKVMATIGRGADFYGPWVLGSTLGERAILPALQGKRASLMGNIDLPHTYTYIDDFGRALVILGERDEAPGQVWHVPNPPALTQRELMTLFCEEIGQPPKMSGTSRLMMWFGGLFIPEARESVEMMYQFEKPFVVDSSKFTRAFGDIATPHREAVKATVAWYRQHLAGASR